MAGVKNLIDGIKYASELPYWAKNIATSYLHKLDDLVDAVPFLKGKQQNLIPGGSKVAPVPTNVAGTPAYFDPRQKNLFSSNAGRTTTYTTPLRGQGELFRGGGGTQVSTIPTTNGPLQIAARQSGPSEVFIDKFGKAIPNLRNIVQQSSMLPPYDGYTPLKYVVDAAGNVIDDVGNAVRNVSKSVPSVGSVGKVLGAAGSYLKSPVGRLGGALSLYDVYSGITDQANGNQKRLDNMSAFDWLSPMEVGRLVGTGINDLAGDAIGRGVNYLFGDDLPSTTTARQVVNQPVQQVPADEYTVGSELYNAARASQAVTQPVPRIINQPVPRIINQPVKTVIAQPVKTVVNRPVKTVVSQPTRQVPVKTVVTQPVQSVVNQSVTPQVRTIDTTFLNLQDAMDNAGIYPDYQGMTGADALRMANQRVDAQVAAYNPAMQVQQEPVDYNAILQEQAMQMQEMQQYQQMQQQPRSRFFEEQPENMFWDPVTERYVTSREFYN